MASYQPLVCLRTSWSWCSPCAAYVGPVATAVTYKVAQARGRGQGPACSAHYAMHLFFHHRLTGCFPARVAWAGTPGGPTWVRVKIDIIASWAPLVDGERTYHHIFGVLQCTDPGSSSHEGPEDFLRDKVTNIVLSLLLESGRAQSSEDPKTEQRGRRGPPWP